MKIDRIFIDKTLGTDDEISFLLSHFSTSPEIVNGSKEVYEYINASSDPISLAKKTLYITKNKGAVIRECPGTSHYTCCDYTILHTGTFCQMDCSYCILQAYFHPPVLQYFAGLDILGTALESHFSKRKINRIGTGEYTDSLIWEPISLMPQFLVKKFADQDSSILELKTKTTNIETLLNLDHNKKTILAWSVNTPEIIRTQERGTAALSARLSAAKKAESKGYRLAFHFDPLDIYQGCETEYKKVVDLIFKHVRPESVVWISLGSFRYMPALKQIIEKRFSESTICYGEFILGLDNKMRYFKPLRIKLYQELIQRLRSYSPNLMIYFCMEDEEVWLNTLGFFPGKEGELGNMLDNSAAELCGLNKEFLRA